MDQRSSHSRWRLLVTCPMAAVAVALVVVPVYLWAVMLDVRLLNDLPQWRHALGPDAALWQATGLTLVQVLCGTVAVLTAIMALLRPRRSSHKLVQAGYGALYVALALTFMAVISVTVTVAGYIEDPTDPAARPWMDNEHLELLRWQLPYLGLIICIIAALAVAQVQSLRYRALQAFGIAVQGPEEAVGDRLIEDLRSGGRDRQYRFSWLTSVALYLLVLSSQLFLFRGCQSPLSYLRPPGSGTPAAEVKVVQQQEKEQVKQIISNVNSPIIFPRPEIEDSEVLEEAVETAQRRYEVTSAGTPGAIGIGGGDTSGWMGPEGGSLRFIRLRHGAREWDDGMTPETDNGDRNLLRWLRRNQAITFPVADNSEAIDITDLGRFREFEAPPFVFMHGTSGFRLSQREQAALRKYLLEDHGLLFADAGSQQWHRSFVNMIQQVTGERLRVIALDDEIFRYTYRLPQGIDPLWAHGGRQAMGIRHRGRWCVIYHPGDVSDVWKDGGFGVSKQLQENGYQFANNVIFYAFKYYTLYVIRNQR